MTASIENEHIELKIAAAARTLTTVAPLLPTGVTIEAEVADARRAAQRGYFLPDEDERIRTVFAHYLRTRAALMSTLSDLRPLAVGRHKISGCLQPQVFAVAFCTACLLVRSGRFLVDSFRKDRVIWKKLDEAEPRYGIPRKQFTSIYKSLTSPRNIWIFLSGIEYAKQLRSQLDGLQDHEVVGPVIRMLRAEEPFLETSRLYYTTGRAKYRWHSFLRRQNSGFKNVTFSLFRISGSLIAEMRMHWKRKRVTPGVQRKIARMLQPGDVIITRHDDATSNLFLPGFWPHGALYIGTEDQRKILGVQMTDQQRQRCQDPVCVLEARKDGVLFRPPSDTFAVDCFVVIRPRLDSTQICEALTRAVTHEGKRYDFEFDFRRSDKLVCTEVAYRAFHGIGQIAFELKQRAGRVCLSAEDLLDYAVDGDSFEVVAIYGCGGNRFHIGQAAKTALIKSYRQDGTGR